ncbi:MAG: CRTAC1 family protein [Vicinamibacteraceae bacterium]
MSTFGPVWIACAIVGSSFAAAHAPATTQGQVRFVDVAARSGLTFRHDNAASADKYLIETMGAGAAWIDVDGDGWLDAYLVNSASTKVYEPDQPLRSALFRNNGNGTFSDVTALAGVAAEGLFGMGVAVGDYDNDDDQDLFVVGYQRSILYRNDGDGAFTDVTDQAGVANRGKWGSSGAWFDYDNDGRLDLVVVNYLDWTPATNLYCGERRPGYRAYCHPNKYRGQTITLYRNRGDGTFADVTRAAGLGARAGNGLGVVCFDYDEDGWMDVFAANDSMENFLFRNLGDGTFEDVSLSSGTALSGTGEAEAGMGVDAGDIDGDGLLDLYVTHLDFELDRLYRNLGDGTFEDAVFSTKLGYESFQTSGFGTSFIDYDNDGRLDIVVVNGHVMDNIQLFHAKTTYAEPKFVFRNLGGHFRNVTKQLGPDLSRPKVSRAAAFGDYDNDGDEDVLVSNNGGEVELLRNDGGNALSWLQVRLVGVKSNRDGVGASVVTRSNGLQQRAQRTGGGSYQSAHDPHLHFGLGTSDRVASVEVRWPSGTIDRLENVRANRAITVREGQGLVASEPSARVQR